MRRSAGTVLLLALLVWAAGATFLLFFRPEVSIALNNWVYQRETQHGRIFLVSGNGPEGFVAFGNERSIYCARPCSAEEIGVEEEQGVVMCYSVPTQQRHVCSARFWPGRNYLVQAAGLGTSKGP